MQVSYKHDVTHSFLVVQPDGEVDTKAYPLRMVLGNAIPGLLPCQIQKADGKALFYYEVASRQQLSAAYQKWTFRELRIIYQGLLRIFEQMDKYLLDAKELILDPEYIYLDKKEENLYLCYLPGYEKPIQEQLRHLTEYLLPLVDHQDGRGVRLSYGVYRLLMESGFQMDAVEELIHRAQAEEDGEEKNPAWQETQAFQDAEDSKGEKEEEETKEEKEARAKLQRREKIWFLASLPILAGLFIFRQMGYFAGIAMPVALAFLFAGLLVMASVAQRKKGQKKKNAKNKKEPQEISAMPPEENMDPEEIIPEKIIPEETPLNESPESSDPALVCEEGRLPPITLNQNAVIIGNMAEVSDALLSAPSISGMHARIRKKEQGYWLADLYSQNGTFLNGEKLESEKEYLLCPGDRVAFADICYRFVEKS